MAIVNGRPAVSYYNSTNGSLRYVRAGDSYGNSWGTPVQVDNSGSVGRYASLAMVNGHPAVTYYHYTNTALYFVRANDANGASWGTPVPVDGSAHVGLHTSLIIANGRPAVSYHDYDNKTLKYVRADDADGTSWGTPVLLDSGGNVGQFNAMAVVDGHPAVSYFDLTNSALKYIRAADVNGDSWSSPVQVDNTDSVGWYTSLAVVNGNPAVSYSDGTNSALKYVRATDAAGTGWGTPVQVDNAASVGAYSSLVVANGKPGICYRDNTDTALKYVGATDVDGNSWSSPVQVDNAGDVGVHTSLVIAENKPAISYQDLTNGALKYARAFDASGSKWSHAIDREMQIAAGRDHTLALKADGTVLATGSNAYGQCNVSSWTGIKQVAGGRFHSVGLKTDGTVVAVGFNGEGQLNVSGWSDIIRVEAGEQYTVGLNKDGTVVAAGYNGVGACNVGSWSGVKEITAGENHTVGLKTDGSVVATGTNSHGQLNVSSWSDIKQISAGRYYTLALKYDGTVSAAGSNDFGESNVSSWTDIIQVDGGGYHTIGLKADGSAVAVGRDQYSQIQVSSMSGLQQVAAGGTHTLGLKSDGTIAAVGDNGATQTDVASWDLTGGQSIVTRYYDSDLDGYGDPGISFASVNQPTGYVQDNTDCSDINSTIFPGASETADDGIDQDCNGSDAVSSQPIITIPADPDPSSWYGDSDGDGFGDSAKLTLSVSQPSGHVSDSSDCNDGDAAVFPGAAETADDGIDQDCDGMDLVTWYKDGDQDGYGDSAAAKTANTQPQGYVSDDSDCNDGDAAVFPGADETANDGTDQDCDGLDHTTWYKDEDQDGFGHPQKKTDAATQPSGFAGDNTDCDDNSDGIYPGAPEIAGDGIDQDCDGTDTPLQLSGTLEADPGSGLAPVTISFITLVAQGTSPFSFEYDFGDGSPPVTGTNKISHTFQDKGTYTVTVTVTDAAGASSDLTVTVEVMDQADLDDLKSQLIIDADQVNQSVQPQELPGILADAQEVIEQSLSAVATADPKVKKEIQEAVREEAGQLITNTKTKITEFVDTGQMSPAEVQNTLAGVEDVVSQMVKNDVAVKADTLTDLETISGDIFSAAADTLLKDTGLSPDALKEIKTDDAKAQAYFTANPYLMDDVVQASGIKIDVVKEFDAAQIEQVGSNQGLDDKQTAQLFNAVTPTPDVEKIIALDAAAAKTIAEIAVEIVDIHFKETTLDQYVIEPIAKSLLLQFANNTYVSFLIVSVAIVDDFVPQGLFLLPGGGFIGVKDAYSIKLIPYPVSPFDLTAEFLKSGMTPTLTNTGGTTIALPGNTTISTGIGWQAVPTNTFNDLTTTFSVVGGTDPSAQAYSLLVNYDTGLSQLIPPAVFALDALLGMLDALVPADYFIDQNTGVIAIGDLNLKPDYLFTAKKSVDYGSIKAAGGFVYGNLGFEVKDFNSDGLFDFGLYSGDPMGFQMLFSVSD